MASISKNGAKGNHKFTLTLSEKSQSTANNETVLSFAFKISSNGGVYNWEDWGEYISYKFTINGKSYSGYIPNYDGKSTITLKSGTQTVAHNTDGSKTISYSFTVTDNAGQYYTCGNASASDTMKLTDISRASSITGGNGYIGSTVAITITSAVSDFKHNVSYVFGSLEGRIAEGISGSTIGWTIPTEFYNEIPNDNSGIGYLVCDTYNGTTLIGSKAINFTATVANSNPILNVSVTDSNPDTIELTGDNAKLIKFYSNATANASYGAQNGASIVSYTVSNGGTVLTTIPATFNATESGIFIFTVTDSRGNTTTKTVNLELIEYIKVTANLAVEKPTATGATTLTIRGNYFNSSFGAVGNTLAVYYQYVEKGGSWGSPIFYGGAVKNGNTYEATINVTGLDYKKAYEFRAYAMDKLAVKWSEKVTVKAIPVFDWSENDFNFNVPTHSKSGFTEDIPVYSNGDCGELTISGNYYIGNGGTDRPINQNGWLNVKRYDDNNIYQQYITYLGGKYVRFKANGSWGDWCAEDYIVEQGTYGIWTYRKWASGKAECWGRESAGFVNINSEWGSCFVNWYAVPAVNYPFAFIGVPNLQATAVYENEGAYWLSVYGVPTNTATPNYAAVRGTAHNTKVAIDFYATGKWK